MEMRQIRYFIEVAKREHVTEASEILHVAQSSVSRQIFNLESELGVDLFIREGRRVRLTPIGKLFLKRMKHIVNIMEEAEREVKEYLAPEKGTVRIAFQISLAAHTLPTIIYAFRKLYPNVKFELKQALYRDLVEGVIKGDFNLAMTAPLAKDNRKINRKILFEDNIVALLPINHPFAKRTFLRLQDLKDEQFVVLPQGYNFREMVVNACRDNGFSPSISFEGDDIDALKGLVSAGLGIALMPQVTLVGNTPLKTVKIPIQAPKLTRSVGVITPTQRELLPTEKLFYQFLSEFYKNT